MVVVEDTEAQTPLVTCQVKVLAPTDNPVTPVLGELGLVIVTPGGPVHTPALTVVLAFNVPVVVLHTVCEEPASDCEGALIVIVAVEVAAAQAPLVTVQVKVLLPTAKPVTPEVGLLGVVTVPEPDVKVQAPVPTVVVAFKFVVVTLHKFCVAPAFDCEGALTLMVTVAVVFGQPDAETVH